MKHTVVVFLLFLMVVPPVSAQFVKGSQVFFDAEGGSTQQFMLRDSVPVFTYPIKNNWYKIATVAYVETALFQKEDSLLDNGTILFNAVGDSIGHVLNPIKVAEFKKAKGKKLKHFTVVRIEGWCFSTKIYQQHIPELVLLKLLNGRKVNLEDQLFEMKATFRLAEKQVGDFSAYAFLRYEAELHPQPDFQYIVILRGGSAFAVVSRERYLELDKVKFQQEEWDFFISFFQKPNAATEKAVIDLAYSFEKL